MSVDVGLTTFATLSDSICIANFHLAPYGLILTDPSEFLSLKDIDEVKYY